MQYPWQLKIPLNAVVFDCDGTLSNIEGIDELARNSGNYQEVSAITTHCMSSTGLDITSYEKRLQLIKPTQSQVEAVVDAYIKHITPGVKDVIKVFQSLGKKIYIISSGIAEAVIPFGNYLGIASDDIYAVHLYFDKTGHYSHFDPKSALVHSGGKLTVMKKILLSASRPAFIGDGISDYEAAKPVARFIGYGGMCFRDKMANLSPYYILCQDLQPLLPLCLTQEETNDLDSAGKILYKNGIDLITNKKIMINKEEACSPLK